MEPGRIYLCAGVYRMGRSWCRYDAVGCTGPGAGIPDAPADSGASARVDSGGCAGDGCHGDLMYLIRQKPQDPPVGRRGFLAHRCELKARAEDLWLGGPPYPERLPGGGIPGGAPGGG